jgi:hypothetical protein
MFRKLAHKMYVSHIPFQDRLCGLVVRVPEVPGSIPGAIRFSEKSMKDLMSAGSAEQSPSAAFYR